MSRISKRIVYCWFGGEKTEHANRCIESWRRVLPDYELVEIGESYIDTSIEYERRMFEDRQWAFLSDSVRLRALEEFGGIYLDTDIYMFKPFPEEMLDLDMFMGSEELNAPALSVIGLGNPSCPLFVRMMSLYRDWDGIEGRTNTSMLKDMMASEGADISRIGNEDVDIMGARIYERGVFCPIPMFLKSDMAYSERTICSHEWRASAVPKNDLFLHELELSFDRHRAEIERMYIENGGSLGNWADDWLRWEGDPDELLDFII